MFSKYILLELLILSAHLVNVNQAACDLKSCNYEGTCKNNTCQCISDKYYTGDKCEKLVDHCSEQPCKNSGVCKSFVGQHICENCAEGYGGYNCHENLENVFTKMILHFQHYAYYGESHDFLLCVETLGKVDFTIELIAENYAINFMEVRLNNTALIKKKWRKTRDLPKVFRLMNLRNWKNLPYKKGYCNVATQTFWTEGIHIVNLTVYDMETVTKKLFHNEYLLLVIQHPNSPTKCIPEVDFYFGYFPHQPIDIDMANYNNFEAIIKKRCYRNGVMTYNWKLYNSLGHELLFNYGDTKLPQLKIPSHSLWFNDYGDIYLTFRIELEVTETYGKFVTITKERCYIYLMPKVSHALIVGGSKRDVGFEQPFTLDASQSRDYAYQEGDDQNLIYKWHCSSEDDPDNEYCKNFKSTAMKVRMKNSGKDKLLLGKTYTYNLTVHSKVYLYGTNTTIQNITIVESPTIPLKIVCVRNCLRLLYLEDRPVHIKVVPAEGNFNFGLKSANATIKWTNEQQEEIGNEHRLIYEPPKVFSHFTYVTVEYKGRTGKADVNFTVNQPPGDGKCTVEPSEGVAFETQFNVTCLNYWDPKLPLIYEFLIDNYTISRNNHCNLTNVRLPPTQNIKIFICDEIWSCMPENLKVSVGPLPNASTYLTTHKNVLSQLLKDGDIREGLILTYILVLSMENGTGADTLIKEIGDFDFQTLLNVEQLITIAKEFCKKLLPFDHVKAKIFAKFTALIRRAFEQILNDGEIEDMLVWEYEQITENLLEISNELCKPWEEMPIAEKVEMQVVTRSHPTIETFLEIPDFDTTALQRVNHWLDLSVDFNKCLHLLGITSSVMHSPTEKPMQYEFPPTASKSYAIDLMVVEEDIDVNETSYTVKFTKECLFDIRHTLVTEEIVIHTIEIKEDSSPFWWYPDNYGLRTDFIYFSIFAVDRHHRKTTIVASIKPFEMTIPFKNQTELEESKILTSHLKSRLHMPIFTANIPANSILIVKFINATIDLRVLVKCGKPPRSYETEKSPYIIHGTGGGEEETVAKTEAQTGKGRRKRWFAQTGVKAENGAETDTEMQKFMVTNYMNKAKYGYMAVLSKDRTTEILNVKTNFSFIMEIQQCLTWDFTLKDPQWSSSGCQAVVHSDTDNAIKCHCTHLSVYGGKAHAIIPAEDLRDDHTLVGKLQINWSMVLLYTSILLLCLLILLYVCCTRLKYQCIVLNTNLKHDNYDVEVFLVTGGPPNAGSTANIIFQFLSNKGPYKVIVYQPVPLLKQNTICKFYMSSNHIDYPFKLKISHDQQGRFPSWYCKQIVINNWQKQRQNVCTIEKWISKESIEYHSDEKLRRKWWQRYRYNLALVYKNWYEFQPCLGPRIYMDLPREFRTCIWISQLLLTIFIVSFYYGPTTMETYEEERDIYRYVRFYVWDIMWLGFCCYIVNFFISILFHFCIHLQLKSNK